MNTVRFVSYAIAGLCLALGMAWGQAPDLSKMDVVMRSLPAGPVAFVDNAPIPREQFVATYQGELERETARRGGGLDDGERVKLAIACLSELAQQVYLRQEAERRGITVTDSEVAKTYSNEIKSAQDAAAAQGMPLPSEEQLLKNTGQTREEAMAAIRQALVLRKTVDAIVKEENIQVSDAEVKAFYEKNAERFTNPAGLHLKQILIKPASAPGKASEADWAASRKRMEQALARIRSGQTFAAVAKDVSEAPDASRGGDMGMLPVGNGRNALPPFFIEAAKGLKPGDLSGIFRSDYGWHLIQLVERSEGSSDSFEEAAPRIREGLLAVKTERAMDAVIKPILEDPSRVQIYMELPRALAEEQLKSANNQP